MMSDLDQRLLLHVRERGLFRESGLALLAVSGGPDSLALLDLMGVVVPKLGLKIAVAHVDHGIAPDSYGIAKRVAEFAGRCGVGAYQETLGLGSATSRDPGADRQISGAPGHAGPACRPVPRDRPPRGRSGGDHPVSCPSWHRYGRAGWHSFGRAGRIGAPPAAVHSRRVEGMVAVSFSRWRRRRRDP